MPDQPEIPAVDVEEAVAMIADGAALIDVREQHEWDEAHVPGAQHLVMGRIDEWWEDLPRDREVVVMCRSGNRSGKVVAALMHQGGMTNVHNLAGGILAWAEANQPLEA